MYIDVYLSNSDAIGKDQGHVVELLEYCIKDNVCQIWILYHNTLIDMNYDKICVSERQMDGRTDE